VFSRFLSPGEAAVLGAFLLLHPPPPLLATVFFNFFPFSVFFFDGMPSKGHPRSCVGQQIPLQCGNTAGYISSNGIRFGLLLSTPSASNSVFCPPKNFPQFKRSRPSRFSEIKLCPLDCPVLLFRLFKRETVNVPFPRSNHLDRVRTTRPLRSSGERFRPTLIRQKCPKMTRYDVMSCGFFSFHLLGQSNGDNPLMRPAIIFRCFLHISNGSGHYEAFC
jgi:hypothetical protein